MDDEVRRLAREIVKAYKGHDQDRRFIVGVAGPPGCGKSTIVTPLLGIVNQILTGSSTELAPADVSSPPSNTTHDHSDTAICISLDGWHHTRAELDKFDDPVEAHWRRGAAFTFDLPSYRNFLAALTAPITPQTELLPFPTFSHSLKDPQPSLTPLAPSHRIVLIEGLYTHLDLPGWRECADLMDLKIWIEVDLEVARQRLVKRNHEAGIVADWDACADRVDKVDMKNGEAVRTHRVPADLEIVSVQQV